MLLCDYDIRTALKNKLSNEYTGTHTIIDECEDHPCTPQP